MSDQLDKAVKVSLSITDSLRSAAEREAKKNHAGNFSAVVQVALAKHLHETGALAPSAADRAHDALSRLIEAEGAERAAELVESALAAEIAA